MTRIIDLSHQLEPGKQRFKLNVLTYNVTEILSDRSVDSSEWYIMKEIELSTHVGTHVEAPLHAIEAGRHAGEISLTSLVGPAAILDFCDKTANQAITLEEVIERGKHICPGDIILIRTGFSKHYGTPLYARPYIETDAIDYLIDHGMKCLGVDCSGIENKLSNNPLLNHRKLFSRNIPLIEDINNLLLLQENRIFFMAFTLPIEGIDASPIRPIAIEPEEAGKCLLDAFLA